MNFYIDFSLFLLSEVEERGKIHGIVELPLVPSLGDSLSFLRIENERKNYYVDTELCIVKKIMLPVNKAYVHLTLEKYTVETEGELENLVNYLADVFRLEFGNFTLDKTQSYSKKCILAEYQENDHHINVNIDVSIFTESPSSTCGYIHGVVKLPCIPSSGQNILFIDPKNKITFPKVNGISQNLVIGRISFQVGQYIVTLLLEDIVVKTMEDAEKVIDYFANGFNLYFDSFCDEIESI